LSLFFALLAQMQQNDFRKKSNKRSVLFEPKLLFMLFKRISFFLLFILISSANFAVIYVPTTADAAAQNVNLEYLNQGRFLYIKTCSSCHTMHLPSEYTKMQWAVSINKMQKRAKITDEQKEMIFRYLITKAK
jgi:hypothetical protein